ncbi:MAG: HAMP domain-containing protein, partial [Gammaproteobacteria bacterium]|nr:HAMP domain-containing protein [Gammaproteobacteria bacterium]
MKIFKKKKSIQYTFLSVLIPSLAITLLVVAVLIGLYVNQSTQSKLAASQESFMTLLEQILSEDLWHYDPASADELLKLATYDKNILFMELSDEYKNVIGQAGEAVPEQGEVTSRVIYAGVGEHKKQVGEIRFQFSASNYKETVITEIIKAVLLLIISIIVITVVMYLVYRRHIHAPIHHIMTTLHAYGKGDSTALVNWDSNDEFGTLATAFNSMQHTLINNQRILVDSALRYQNLYNKTPALLFSMNTEGVITDASVYFLHKLAYKKSSLIGLSMSEMVCENFPGSGTEIAA